MKIIKPYYMIRKPNLDDPDADMKIYRDIEDAGRTCYVSGNMATSESGKNFVKRMVEDGHEAMLEHGPVMSVKFVVDRGISHELVRHRICSFAQESQRYCNYSKDKFGNEITFIEPWFYHGVSKEEKAQIENIINEGEEDISTLSSELSVRYLYWRMACMNAEETYFCLLRGGATPQEARAVLPNSTKTEIVVTANLREWRNIFKLRAAGEHGKPHPQMLEVMVPLLNECKMNLPEIFYDIEPMEIS